MDVFIAHMIYANAMNETPAAISNVDYDKLWHKKVMLILQICHLLILI